MLTGTDVNGVEGGETVMEGIPPDLPLVGERPPPDAFQCVGRLVEREFVRVRWLPIPLPTDPRPQPAHLAR